MKPPELAASLSALRNSLQGTEIHRRNGDLIEVIEARVRYQVRIFRSRTKAGMVFAASVITVGPSARVVSCSPVRERRKSDTPYLFRYNLGDASRKEPLPRYPLRPATSESRGGG